MRYRFVPILILYAVIGASAARGDFHWLEDWQVTDQRGSSSFRVDPASPDFAVALDAYATYQPPDSPTSASIGISRRFDVSSAPAGLALILTATLDGLVDRVPYAGGFLFAKAKISGIGIEFDVEPPPYTPEDPYFTLYEGRDYVLADGVYTVNLELSAGINVPFPGQPPGIPADSFGTLRVGIELVPSSVSEPSSASLLVLVVPAVGPWLLRRSNSPNGSIRRNPNTHREMGEVKHPAGDSDPA